MGTAFVEPSRTIRRRPHKKEQRKIKCTKKIPNIRFRSGGCSKHKVHPDPKFPPLGERNRSMTNVGRCALLRTNPFKKPLSISLKIGRLSFREFQRSFEEVGGLSAEAVLSLGFFFERSLFLLPHSAFPRAVHEKECDRKHWAKKIDPT